MSEVTSWSTTAASNDSAVPDGFPDTMNPAGLNNSAREVMAAIKRHQLKYQALNVRHALTTGFGATTVHRIRNRGTYPSNTVMAVGADGNFIYSLSGDDSAWSAGGHVTANAINGIDLNTATNVCILVEFNSPNGDVYRGTAGPGGAFALNASYGYRLYSVCYGGSSKWAIVGGQTASARVILSSANDWVVVNDFSSYTGADNALFDVCSDDGTNFVAVGEAGTIYTTTDVTTGWTARTSGVATNLNCCAYGNGIWVALGESNVMRRSTDTINWAAASTAINGNWNSVAWNGYMFVAGGDASRAAYSFDGNTWYMGNEGGGSSSDLTAIEAVGQAYWLTGGSAGTITQGPKIL